jgi:DNA-binding NarL/FixJ family response regulator
MADRTGNMIRVVVVDDDPLVRSALGLMLGGQADLEVVGEAGNGRLGVDLARDLLPDVVLMDIRMPVLNGLEATRELHGPAHAESHGQSPPPRVIVLTTFDADDYVVEALAAGADGFLLKDTPPSEIVSAIRAVADGEAMLSPSVTNTLIQRFRKDAAQDRSASVRRAAAKLSRLTDRETEVAVAVGHGLTNAEIAVSLFMSVPTVKAHVSRLFDKLETTNRVQIAICVHDAGLV